MNELLESFCLLVEARLNELIEQLHELLEQLLYKLVEHSCTLYVLMTGIAWSVVQQSVPRISLSPNRPGYP